MRERIKAVAKVSLTLIIGFIGAQVFIYFSLPLPWLLGSISATAIASRFEFLPIKSAKFLSPPARSVLGMIVGSAFTPAILNYLGTFVTSLVMVIPYILTSSLCGLWYYHKVIKLDKRTAFLSAMPGGLLEMIAIGEEMGANIYKITLLQSTRLLFIVFSLPFLIELIGGMSLDGNRVITTPLSSISFHDIIFMILIATLGVSIAKKIRLSGAWIIGPMIVSVIFYMSGFITARPPDELIKFVQVILGSSVGFVFRGVSVKEVITTILSTFGYFIIIALVGAAFITLVHFITDFDLLSILLAFAPGGQAEINLIAILVAVNLPYVALHHVFRMFLVMGVAPIFAKRIQSS